MDQIRGLMRLLQIPCISHVPREANVAAHSIANFVALILFLLFTLTNM